MNKYKRLFNDSLIYMIGNFGSKLVSLIMVSFYTYTLSTSDYGTLDVTQTTIYMLLPLVTCCVHEAILTYTLKTECESNQVLSNGMLIFSVNMIALIVLAVCSYWIVPNANTKWIVVLIVLEGINTILLQYCRAIDQTKIYAFSGIITTFIISASNIVFLKYWKMGLQGYYLSMTIAYFLSICILVIGSKAYKNVSIHAIDIGIIKKMLKFSLPLIPNSLMWWGMNMLDKYVILYYLGNSYNGIYAVAAKIPTILTTLSSIFIQAWQVSAIRESDSEDKDVFHTKIFDGLLFFNFLAMSGILVILKPLLAVTINSDYTNVWKYVPFLLLGTVFSSLAAFLEANYHASKQTKKLLKSSITGVVSNLILNLILVQIVGLNGAAIATAASFALICMIRIIDSKEFVKIQFKIKKYGLYSFIILAEMLAVYYTNAITTAIVCICAVGGILVINRDFIRTMFPKNKQ